MIRQATLEDISALASLSLQLGYTGDTTEIITRLEKIIIQKNAALFVQEVNGTIAGWVHVYGKTLLQMEYCEIGGLVVDESQRRLGVGKELMKRCETWALENGYDQIRLRSGAERKEAHRFYENIGYECVKKQEVFTRKL
ncbi:GNAT family N-acetyltransferase [Fictibacillus sp. KU28468]|uniref:GNAT family N-acetyltransferase n=1 Tax=Fictibacillus sp. KU28468 TaxID=2991053 RepID=UPI00223DE4C0|nr:GNAT family N-acetyltransferase [Fictibacillus sp. KU28468]UZJ78684.1 GNAT family N-acetyltransferase [Fictibacillus sp. KU28468]